MKLEFTIIVFKISFGITISKIVCIATIAPNEVLINNILGQSDTHNLIRYIKFLKVVLIPLIHNHLQNNPEHFHKDHQFPNYTVIDIS